MELNKYFDNATTSYPKPSQMCHTLAHYYDHPIGSYGRSADKATLHATLAVEALRDDLGKWLGVERAENICFTDNATTAINTILQGSDYPLGKVLVSPMEHNAVMRPLQRLIEKGVIQSYDIMPHDSDGRVNTEALIAMRPEGYDMAIVNMESNVNGVKQPLYDIAQVCHSHNIRLLADATQIPGSEPQDAHNWQPDFIAFTGHKGLLGPTGTGGFYVRQPQKLQPLTTGGNGVHSHTTDMQYEMPDRFIAGTPNTLGLVAWATAMKHIPQYRISQNDLQAVLREIEQLHGIKLLRSLHPEHQGYLFSMIHTTMSPAFVGDTLRERYGILTRNGLHCAPLAHRTLGTLPHGAVRFSLSPYHSLQDMEYLIKSLYDLFGR